MYSLVTRERGEMRSVRSTLKWPVIAWAAFIVATGFYVSDGAGIIGGIAAVLAIVALAVSLQDWAHLVAMPLYLLFASEALAATIQAFNQLSPN